MGCNCKNKQNKPSKIEVAQADLQEVKTIAMDTITQMENILEAWNANPTGRVVLQKFMLETFGEVVSNYCDIPCKNRLKKRLDKLKNEIK